MPGSAGFVELPSCMSSNKCRDFAITDVNLDLSSLF